MENVTNYIVETKIKTIPTTALNEFRDVERFITYCRDCPNYGTKYSCPPHDIDDEEFLSKYTHAHFILTRIIYDEETILSTKDDKQKQNEILYSTRAKVLRDVEDQKIVKELYSGGISVGSSACSYCTDCARKEGKDCRYPEKMRYAIDSFGFDITKIMSDLFGIELSWPKDTIPEYQCLVGMFLDDDDNFFLD